MDSNFVLQRFDLGRSCYLESLLVFVCNKVHFIYCTLLPCEKLSTGKNDKSHTKLYWPFTGTANLLVCFVFRFGMRLFVYWKRWRYCFLYSTSLFGNRRCPWIFWIKKSFLRQKSFDPCQSIKSHGGIFLGAISLAGIGGAVG